MNLNQQHCRQELEASGLVPRKYYGQVFTTDNNVTEQLIKTIQSIYRPGSKIIEIGGGLGYITEKLAERFSNIDVLEIDDDLYEILKSKIEYLKLKANVIRRDILEYEPPEEEYLLVGNIPFHVSGRLYRRFMSELGHKPYGMVFITDKNYAKTLMGQPPRCYRVSLQAQAYGDIEIVEDVPPSSVYPEPKVMSCIMKITQNDLKLPGNFWDVVNYHWEHFPTDQVKSPKQMGLKKWIELCEGSAEPRTSCLF